MTPDERPSRWHLAALAGLSAGMLAFEILLLRLFEFSHWHHFAGFAIALALLGLGAAGTTLALLGGRDWIRGNGWFLGGLLATALGLLLVLGVHSQIALRPVFAAWEGGELARLLVVDLAAFVPFYGAGLAIGQVFIRWPRYTGRLYAANLLGSGAGSAAASLLLTVVPVEAAVAWVAAALLALGTALATGQRRRLGAAVCLVAFLATLPLAWRPPAPAVSDFKALAKVRDLPDSRVLATRAGLHGRLTLVRSASLRSAPGLSLAWPDPVPATDAVIIGSDTHIPLPRTFPPDFEHAKAALPGLPFILRPQGPALVLGAGAWQSPAMAGPDHRVTWVNADRRVLDLAQARGAEPPRYRLVSDTPRHYLDVSDATYRLILADRVYDGGDAAGSDYLLTAGGLSAALARLRPDGLLAIPLPLAQPPRHLPRLLNTVRAALAARGIDKPAAHVAALRGLQTHLLLVSPAPLSQTDLAALRAFADRWQFDIDWPPVASGTEPAPHHRTGEPVFRDTARAVLTGTGELPDNARWFVTGAAGDDQPYFWRSLRWTHASHLLNTLGARGASYLDWSLIFSAAAVVAVTVLAFILILAPLGRLPGIERPFSRRNVAVYFALLGLGYMLIELALFQRMIRFTGQPVLTAAVVFAVFMIGSGFGSLTAPQQRSRRAVARIWIAAATGFALTALAFWPAAGPLQHPPAALRLTLAGLLILPLAWALGRPFPWALRQLDGRRHWIPWAWGINGFASVAAASLAPLISVHGGQTLTLAAGALCYLLALGPARRWTRPAGAG